MESVNGAERIFVALDTSTLEEAHRIGLSLAPIGVNFKVGLGLLYAYGVDRVINAISSTGREIFVDTKLCDTPDTVAVAARTITSLGPAYFTVMTSAGRASIRAAVENKQRSKVLAVTVLTSTPPNECLEIYGDQPEKKVFQLAQMAVDEGAEGIVCSPKELSVLREIDVPLICPGIRPENCERDNHQRFSTPQNAIRNGASKLVIGRPIINPRAPFTPLEVARQIAEAINKSA